MWFLKSLYMYSVMVIDLGRFILKENFEVVREVEN